MYDIIIKLQTIGTIHNCKFSHQKLPKQHVFLHNFENTIMLFLISFGILLFFASSHN